MSFFFVVISAPPYVTNFDTKIKSPYKTVK